jgi:hypothetical protein
MELVSTVTLVARYVQPGSQPDLREKPRRSGDFYVRVTAFKVSYGSLGSGERRLVGLMWSST